MNCRFCKTELKRDFVDLINSPLSNSYLSHSQLNEPEVYYPLKLYVCEKCFLVQIDEYQKATEIFNSEYAYFSSFSTSWLEHARNYVERMTDRFKFNDKSLVIEIASNDGYLLQYFKQKGVPVLGVEPTLSTATVARSKGIESVVEFFGKELASKLVKENRKADLILGKNVLAHVPDLNDFVGGLKIVLKDNGVATMEFPHLVQMIKHNQFDTIYHEHFSYISFTTIQSVFAFHGLELFDVEEWPTHGGSIRIFAKHKEDSSKVIEKSVSEMLAMEKAVGVTDMKYYDTFKNKISSIKIDFISFLSEQKRKGKKVASYGAAAKGNTLLNYCGVKNDMINFVVDASPHKQGKYMPGSHIPILSEEIIKKEKPDFIVIFPWNIKEEIMNQLSYVREWGGQFVIPIRR